MSATPKSLLEHLPLDRHEIEQREVLVGITPDDGARLARCWPAIRAEADALVAACVQRQRQARGEAGFATDRATLEQMQRSLMRFVESAFCGPHDADYAGSRLQIGFVHRRVGLPARYFLAALHYLQVGFRQIIAERVADPAEAAAALAALERRLLFDESLIIDAYEHRLAAEARREHNRALRYATTLEREVQARTRELEQLSRTDALTGLRNRRAFQDELSREVSRARRQRRPLAALYLDVDDFKALNDREGHGRGDAALAAIAASLLGTLREIDVAARLGGDEFCVLLPDTNRERALAVADRLRQRIRASGPVTVSIGAAVLENGDWDHPDGLIERADAEMYRDKARPARRDPVGRRAG